MKEEESVSELQGSVRDVCWEVCVLVVVVVGIVYMCERKKVYSLQ